MRQVGARLDRDGTCEQREPEVRNLGYHCVCELGIFHADPATDVIAHVVTRSACHPYCQV